MTDGLSAITARLASVVADMNDVLYGRGEHLQHQREQVGRCVHCSCGQRVQGRMIDYGSNRQAKN